MQINALSNRAAVAALAVTGCARVALPGKRELMFVANDEKQAWDADGKVVLSAGGRDTLSVIDIGTNPLAPTILVNLREP